MSQETEVLEILREAEAIITDSHIVYAAGNHGREYVNKDAVYPHTRKLVRLCSLFATRFEEEGVQVVIGPAIGAVLLASYTAWHLSDMAMVNIPGVYAEKETLPVPDPGPGRKLFVETGGFVIKRGYDKFIAGKNVLVVEDILTTGGSARKVVEAVRAIGGKVIGVAALCNRGGVTAADVGDVPVLFALANVKLDSWSEADCPMCKAGVPINTEVGKGREFLARRA